MQSVSEPSGTGSAALRRRYAEIGQDLASVVLSWRDFNHRKVEAIALLEGARARRRISLDVTPVALTWPPIQRQSDRTRPSPAPPSIQIVAPLTLIEKAPMRSLDVTDSSGRSLPVLGRRDNGLLATAALDAVITAEIGSAPSDEAWHKLYRLAFADREGAGDLAEDIIAEHSLDSVPANFVRDLAGNFLLCAVLAATAANMRQVIKYSYHWQADDIAAAGSGNLVERSIPRLSAGLGFTSFAIQLNLGSPSSAASYHLEVPAPQGLICTAVRLPMGAGGEPQDTTVTAFGHAYECYDGDPADSATIELAVSSHGLHPAVSAAAVGTASFFLLAVLLPNALDTLRSSRGGANGLLLFGPALLLALVAGRQENTLVSALLLPLRLVAVLLSGLLFVGGASLVGQLQHPWITDLWWLSTVVTVVVAILLSCATCRIRSRGG